jgi:hypothetical protein
VFQEVAIYRELDHEDGGTADIHSQAPTSAVEPEEAEEDGRNFT